jgi:hypothetical protein
LFSRQRVPRRLLEQTEALGPTVRRAAPGGDSVWRDQRQLMLGSAVAVDCGPGTRMARATRCQPPTVGAATTTNLFTGNQRIADAERGEIWVDVSVRWRGRLGPIYHYAAPRSEEERGCERADRVERAAVPAEGGVGCERGGVSWCRGTRVSRLHVDQPGGMGTSGRRTGLRRQRVVGVTVAQAVMRAVTGRRRTR